MQMELSKASKPPCMNEDRVMNELCDSESLSAGGGCVVFASSQPLASRYIRSAMFLHPSSLASI